MKAKIITVLFLAASGLMPAAFGQSPTSPDPSVQDAPTVPETPRAAAAPAINPTSPSRANQVVYNGRLPTVQELTDAASAKGSTITRVEQTESEILTTYRFASGQESVVAYRLLPTAGSKATVSAPVVTSAPPSVVYVPSSRAVYYDSYRYYDPWYWYPYAYPYSTVAFGIGFGYYGYHYGHHHGHGGGYYHGGYGHGGHYRSGYAHGGHYRGGYSHGGHHRHR